MEANPELRATQEALKRVTREMMDLKSEIDKIKHGESSKGAPGVFALGFNHETFNAMNYTSGLLWVANTLAVNMKKSMDSFKGHFEILGQLGDVKKKGSGHAQGSIEGRSAPVTGTSTKSPIRGFKVLNTKNCDFTAALSAWRRSGSWRDTNWLTVRGS
jgi:hypothetical protein